MEEKNKKKLFVGNLSWKTSEEKLKEHFESVGEVTSAKIVIDQMTGKSRGFGFVEMPESAATAAVTKLNDQPLDDRKLRVSYAEDRERSSGGGGGSGGPRGERREYRGGGGGGANSGYGSRSNYRDNQ